MPDNLCVTALSCVWLNITASSVWCSTTRSIATRCTGISVFGEAVVPSTDAFFDNMVSLPFSHLLTDVQIEQIIAATRETVEFLRL